MDMSEKEKLIFDRNRLLQAMRDVCPNNFYYSDSRTKLSNTISLIELDLMKDFLSISQDDNCKISYAKCEDDYYNNKKRIKTSLGKYIRRRLEVSSDEISDDELFVFCNKVNSLLVPLSEVDSKIRFLSGKDIQEYYASCDEITHSCMTASSSWKTETYALNPDKVKLLIYNNELRALFWTTDDGVNVLDRIYPANHGEAIILKNWAIQHGYLYRSKINEADYDQETKLSDNSQRIITIKYNDSMPYMDTFKFGNVDETNKIIELSNCKDTDYNYLFTFTDGSISQYFACHNCDGNISPQEEIRIDGNCYCQDCASELFTFCSSCEEYYDESQTIYCDNNNNYYCLDCAKRYLNHCSDCDCYYNYTLFETKNGYVCESCRENYIYCECCNLDILAEDIIIINDEAICDDCYNKKYSYCAKCEKYILKDEFSSEENLCNDCLNKQSDITDSNQLENNDEVINRTTL